MMNPKNLLLGGISLIVSAPINGNKIPEEKPKKYPNIILIYADDLGYGDIGCYGQKYIKTPNIDQMAKDGIKFTQIYTGAPVSAPARCCMLTGKNSMHAWVRDNLEIKAQDEAGKGQMPIPDEEYTMPEMLKKAGYKTALIGKWGLGPMSSPGAPNKQGFDFFYGYNDQNHAHNHYPSFLWRNDKMEPLKNNVLIPSKFDGIDPNDPAEYKKYNGTEYSLDLMADEAIKFIKENKDTPFFIDLSVVVPHKALQVPDESLKIYDGVFNEKPYLGGAGYLPHPRPLSAYAAMITRLDDKVGLIIKTLKELGLDMNTIVIFAGDNGPASGGGLDARFFNSSGSFRGSKSQVYEGGIREPFIVRWPDKVKPGTVSDYIGAQYDLMATFADITGQSIENTDGLSILPTLTGNEKKQKQHEFLYWEFPSGEGQVAIRIGDWKGVRRYRMQGSKWEVYNLKNDPKETTDLSSEHPDLIKRFDEIVKLRTPSQNPNWNFMDIIPPK